MMNVVEERMTLLQISDSWGFNEKVAPLIMKVLEESNPDFYLFVSPSPIVAFYKIDVETESIIEKVKDVIRTNGKELEHTKVYKVNKEFIVQRDKSGKIIKQPIGGIINRNENIVFEQNMG